MSDLTLSGESSTAGLIQVSALQQALAEADTPEKAVIGRVRAAVLLELAKKAGATLQQQNPIAEIRLRFERKAGELLEPLKPGRPRKSRHDVGIMPTYQELGINEKQGERWQQIARIPEDVFDQYIREVIESNEELTTAGLLRTAKDGPAHVSRHCGEQEWFTPSEYIEAARTVLGAIDLDPASTSAANAVVKADTFYTAESNGLSVSWHGRVWLNPPYTADLVARFCSKLVTHYTAGDVTSAVVLVNNATETKWFQHLATYSQAICFPAGRIRFWGQDKTSGPLQGQTFFYFGNDIELFAATFGTFGVIGEVRR